MKLSIIILIYKSFQDANECLERLFQYAPAVPFEVIVIDNNSGDEKSEAKFKSKWIENNESLTGKIRYLPQDRNLGYGKGNNIGLRAAKGEYILVMNPDVRVTKGLLDELITYMDGNRTVGIVGPQLLFTDKVIQDSYRNFPSFTDQIIKRVAFLRRSKFLRRRVSNYLLWTRDPHLVGPVDWIVGAFILIRRKAYDEVGGFDPRFFLFMEDVDLCRRMWHKGWQVVYYARAHALHKKERLSQGGILDIFRKKTLRIHLTSALKYFWKWRGKPLPR